MAISFPTSLDTFTTRISGDTISEDHMNDVQDAIEALEAKVGVNSSAVVTSLDYLVKNASSSNPGHKHTVANGATDCSTRLANLTDSEVQQLEAIGAETISAAQWGYLAGLTATDTEINLACDGITATAAELNTMDGISASTAELNLMDGVTATTAEINRACDLSVNNFFGTARAVYFWEDTAPTGWTIDATCADCVLAVKGGTQDYNVAGGTKAASSWTALGIETESAHTHAGPSHIHTMPTHYHVWYDFRSGLNDLDGYGNTMTGTSNSQLGIYCPSGSAQKLDADHYTSQVDPGDTNASGTDDTGAGTAHLHTFDGTWRPPGGVGIIGTKDA